MSTNNIKEVEDSLSREIDILENAVSDENLALAVASREHIWKLVYRLVGKYANAKLEEAVREIVGNLKKPIHEKNYQIPLRGTMVYEINYNQALSDTISIINNLKSK